MRVTGLFTYPLKSARGIPLPAARLDGLGIVGDRRWAILGPEGKAITQRDVHALATLEVRPGEGGIELQAEGHDALHVPTPDDGPRLDVSLFEDATEGVSAGTEAEEWISRFMGRPGRIVYMPDDVERPVSRRYGRVGDRVSFADGYPLLLTSEASLASLNDRLDEPVSMSRFRPNLVIDGEAPFGEDHWTVIQVGEVGFRVAKPCARCVVTTVDQETGVAGSEPLRTLAAFRRRESDGKVLFGQNVIQDAMGVIRLGDEVRVVAKRP